MSIISFFCCSTGRPGLLGQLPLSTLATQTPRNSRGAAGGCGSGGAAATLGCACTDAHEHVERAMTRRRIFATDGAQMNTDEELRFAYFKSVVIGAPSVAITLFGTRYCRWYVAIHCRSGQPRRRQ